MNVRKLIPRKQWQEIVLENRRDERITDIESSIARYIKAKRDIPYQWVEELNEYNKK